MFLKRNHAIIAMVVSPNLKEDKIHMMQYTKPIYITRKDTFLASDEIVPYGDRISVVSESTRKSAALELLSAFKINLKKETETT